MVSWFYFQSKVWFSAVTTVQSVLLIRRKGVYKQTSVYSCGFWPFCPGQSCKGRKWWKCQHSESFSYSHHVNLCEKIWFTTALKSLFVQYNLYQIWLFFIFFYPYKIWRGGKSAFFGKCSASSPKECKRFSNSENFWILKMKLWGSEGGYHEISPLRPQRAVVTRRGVRTALEALFLLIAFQWNLENIEKASHVTAEISSSSCYGVLVEREASM